MAEETICHSDGELLSAYQRRLTTPGVDACYLLTTRFCSNSPLFGPEEMRVFRKQLEQTLGFCGIRLLNFVLLEDHFHLLVRVPRQNGRDEISREELLQRISCLYGDDYAALLGEALLGSSSVPAQEHFGHIWLQRGVKLISAAESAEAWAARELERLRGMMHDVSMFMKLLKQRFSIYFNSTHGRYGTLWGDPYRSLLVEENSTSLLAASAYIDLNAVRRGIVAEPTEYAFCGAGEAQRGAGIARDGLRWMVELDANAPSNELESWGVVAQRYHRLIWEERVDGAPRDHRPGMAAFFGEKHNLFLRGTALGALGFVQRLYHENRAFFGLGSRCGAASLAWGSPGMLTAGSWGYAGLWVLRSRTSL
jgi:REP element-mobilizing transposase RayT